MLKLISIIHTWEFWVIHCNAYMNWINHTNNVQGYVKAV